MLTLNSHSADFQNQLDSFLAPSVTDSSVSKAVETILQDVRLRGDAALIEHSERIDKVRLTPETLRVPKSELERALGTLSPAQRTAIEASIASVRAFHERGLPQNWRGTNLHGATVGERYYPLQRVGLYIPGGRVPLVSTVVMTATLAKLAGVPSIAAFTPCAADGTINSSLLAAFALTGITEVYRLGGPMAVGAMAYGTRTVPAVVKIFGPGSAYLNEAKRQVFGTIGIDLLAGPSEVMIIADSTANPDFIAADILAQAEHDPRVRIIVITPEKAILDATLSAIELQKTTLKHRAVIDTVLATGTLCILTKQLTDSIAIANHCAPEHLELQVAESALDSLTQGITTAGAIFEGHHTPTVLGDFAAGPNHTLPTALAGRYLSGLRIVDFFRRSSTTRYDSSSVANAAPTVAEFSNMEQLDAHGRSLTIRL
ncbi:MAG: histidinol dehydrogenase [Verrucomicrobiota bacterium]|nr:histidinol dehydrogenase [Verrucomicrobiota bacterium]